MQPAPLLKDAELAQRAGRLAEAERIYRQILAADGQNPVAAHHLALILKGRNELAEAERLMRASIRTAPREPAFHNNLGNLLRSRSNLPEAEACYRRAIALKPGYAEAHYNLGIALKNQDRLDEALAALRHAVALRPDYAEAMTLLGAVFKDRNELAEALSWLDRALAANPDYMDAHYYRGTVLGLLGRDEEAVEALTRAVALKSDNLDALKALVRALKRLDRYDEAILVANRWSKVAPQDSNAPASIAHLFLEARSPEFAGPYIERALALEPGNADHAVIAGHIAMDLGEAERAVSAFKRAVELAPDRASVHVHLAGALKVAGRMDEAMAVLRKASAIDPKDAWTRFEMAESNRFTEGDPLLAEMESAFAGFSANPGGAPIVLYFALGKAYDDIGDTDRAFRYFSQGNALKLKELRYDEARTLANFDQLIEAFTPEILEKKRGSGDPSELPIFIVGLPRSGSTLVEQVLASHPQVAGGGEILDFSRTCASYARQHPELAGFPASLPRMTAADFRAIGENYVKRVASKAKGKPRLTDKLLTNSMLIGLIHLVLPNAKIILCSRNPVDLCFSCYTKLFHEELAYTYDLGTLGRQYRKHHALMEHWRKVLPRGSFLDVQYESVVANTESEARKIIAYCGLEWDPACLEFHKTDRPVRTASVSQVRQPIYTRAVKRWRRYEKYLAPLLDALGDLAPPREAEGVKGA